MTMCLFSVIRKVIRFTVVVSPKNPSSEGVGRVAVHSEDTWFFPEGPVGSGSWVDDELISCPRMNKLLTVIKYH